MFTDGKTLTDVTAISFYTLDVCSPTIFSWPCLVKLRWRDAQESEKLEASSAKALAAAGLTNLEEIIETQQVELFRISLPRTFDIVSIFDLRISDSRPIRTVPARHFGCICPALGKGGREG